MIAILLVAHNQPRATWSCISSMAGTVGPDVRILLLDNGSTPSLRIPDSKFGTLAVELTRSDTNLGFAAGMNRLLAEALHDPDVDTVLLLNNDTVARPGFLERMRSRLDPDRNVDMIAARMLDASDGVSIDSLGISLYRSGIASNRKNPQERLLGPTGGCMLLTRRLLEDVRASFGTWFDESFFCYAEDTDLVMRARWLGYQPACADDAEVLHHGSLSSGGADNEFILYHGIRNSIWALLKNAPMLWLVAHLPWILVAHGGIWLRNLKKGRWRTLCRLYWHALRGLPQVLGQRVQVRRVRRLPPGSWWQWVEPRLYEPGFLRRAVRELFR